MHRKRPTRIQPFHFEFKKKTLLRLGQLKTEEDLFEALCRWLDYYDPIGIVWHPSIHHEYAPEVRELIPAAKDCRNSDEFALEIQKCIIEFFSGEDLVKPHFWKKHGYRRVAEIGWKIWRRYQFDSAMTPLMD